MRISADRLRAEILATVAHHPWVTVTSPGSLS